jgi:ABC-2 type transport system ATP-binding protein
MIEIKNFSKSYDGIKKAVDNLSLTIEAGDIYGFVGHNGAGKTTLLKSISGLIDFNEGDIFVDGISVKQDMMAVKKIIAYVPDNPDVYETMKGIEYLNFIGDVFKVSLERRTQLINKYTKMFGMENVLNQTISEYSHGMKQKIVLIGALIHEPKVMLLDEPFVGLDPQASFLLKQEFKEMCDRGTAIFFSTHVLEVVEKLCNKVAIIKQGKIVEAGLTEKIISNKSLESIFMELANQS